MKSSVSYKLCTSSAFTKCLAFSFNGNITKFSFSSLALFVCTNCNISSWIHETSGFVFDNPIICSSEWGINELQDIHRVGQYLCPLWEIHIVHDNELIDFRVKIVHAQRRNLFTTQQFIRIFGPALKPIFQCHGQ